MVLSDPDGNVLVANQAYYELYGYTADQVLGQNFAIIFPPEVRDWANEQYQLVFAAEEVPHVFEATIQRADGEVRQVETRINFVIKDGRRAAMQSVIRDITERKRAEQALREAQVAAERATERMSRLQKLTANLADALTVERVAAVVLEQAVPLLDARAATMALLSDDENYYDIIDAVGLQPEQLALWRRFPVTAPLPLADAVRRREMLLFPDRESALRAYPGRAFFEASPNQAWALVPFQGRDGAAGGLTLSYAEPQTFDDEHRKLLLALAEQCAQAVQRARLYTAQQRARAELELRVQERTAELTAMNARLTEEIEQRQAADAGLAASLARLRALSARLEKAQEEERLHLSRELHDQLGGALTALKMDLFRTHERLDAESDLGREFVAIVSAAVDEMLDLVRRLATDLRPPVLDDLGLVAALEWQLREFEKRTGCACRLEAPKTPPNLKPECAIAVFRVFQECLTNIARHAQAHRVEVKVACSEGQMTLSVRDNGRGFSTSELRGREGLGLLSMRERLHQVQGEFSIESRPGCGTTVRLWVPLELAGPTGGI